MTATRLPYSLLLVWGLLFSIGHAQAAAPVPLAAEGQALVAIDFAPEDQAELRATAETLADYLGQISGATFVVQPEAEAGAPAGRIRLQLAPDHPRLADRSLAAYLINTDDAQTVTLAARSSKALSDAAHHLLAELGVRWLAPGKRWTVVPEKPTLTLPPTDMIEEPTFAHRDIWFAYGFGLDESKEVLLAGYQRWHAGNRLGGVARFNSGHTYPSTVGKHKAAFEAHPEYFAMQPNGERLPFNTHTSLCYSNPDVAAFFVQDKLAELAAAKAKNPHAYSVSMDPNDSSIACSCQPCQALGNGSDQALYLANQVAAALRQPYPDAIVSFYVYASHRLPPERIQAEPNVYVQVATAFNKSGLTMEELVTRWRETVTAVGIRDYLGVMAWDWGLPGRARGARFSYVKEAIPRYKRWGAIAYNSEMNINWAAHGPATTVAAQLLWDPTLDADALYAAWFADAYGPAAGTMQALYDSWEQDQKLSRDNLHQWYRQLELAFREAADAGPEINARLTDMVVLLHYCRLFRDWERAERTGDRETAYAALKPLLEFTWRTRERGMVHAYALQRRLVNSGAPVLRPLDPDWHFKTPDAVWKYPIDMADSELLQVFQQDLLETPADDRYRDFSGPLVTIQPDPNRSYREPTGFLRRSSVWQVRVPEGAPTDVDLQMTGVRFDYKLSVTNADGDVVATSEAGVQTSERYEQQAFVLPLTLPGPGDYSFRFQAGEDYRPTFPREWIVGLDLRAEPNTMLRFYGDAGFYVPPGTKRLLIQTDGRLSLYIPGRRGEIQLTPADADPEEECLVIEVPDGAADRVWVIANSTSATCHLMNIPSLIGRVGAPMIIPQDALTLAEETQADDD